jgi:hypothetical protein
MHVMRLKRKKIKQKKRPFQGSPFPALMLLASKTFKVQCPRSLLATASHDF